MGCGLDSEQPQIGHKEALIHLNQDQGIVILCSDKGSGFVILDRTEYGQKLTSVLSVTTKFRKDDRLEDNTKVSKTISTVGYLRSS